MIDYRLIELFDTLPEIVVDMVSYKPNYDFGTEEDVNRFIQSKRDEGVPYYPLIWLITPVETKGVVKKRGTIELIIAELNRDVDMSNRVRYEKTFKNTIIPTKDNVLKAIRKSGFITITDKDNLGQTAYFNYGTGEKQNQNDIWDAIKITIEIQFDNCKMNNINY